MSLYKNTSWRTNRIFVNSNYSQIWEVKYILFAMNYGVQSRKKMHCLGPSSQLLYNQVVCSSGLCCIPRHGTDEKAHWFALLPPALQEQPTFSYVVKMFLNTVTEFSKSTPWASICLRRECFFTPPTLPFIISSHSLNLAGGRFHYLCPIHVFDTPVPWGKVIFLLSRLC